LTNTASHAFSLQLSPGTQEVVDGGSMGERVKRLASTPSAYACLTDDCVEDVVAAETQVLSAALALELYADKAVNPERPIALGVARITRGFVQHLKPGWHPSGISSGAPGGQLSLQLPDVFDTLVELLPHSF
jgi:hypothetical protein